VNTGMASWKSGQVYHNGHYFGVWDSYGLSKYKFRTASFNEDSRGRWYFNVVVSVEEKLSPGQDAIGIDLGLKEVATCSEGTELGVGRWYRTAEARLAVAQRANKKVRVKALHAKIKNQRKDALHKSASSSGKSTSVFQPRPVRSAEAFRGRKVSQGLE
jgi:putative transposase